MQQEDACSAQSGLEVILRLCGGIGVSVVSREPPQELICLSLRNIHLVVSKTPSQTTLDCSIGDIQCDNQVCKIFRRS